MKTLLRVIVPALLLLSLSGGSALAQGRIATIDLRKTFDGYWKTKKADAQLKERAADMEKEHKSMLEDFKKGKDEYQTLLGDANNQVLSPEEREKRKKAAEDKLKQLKESEETVQQYERQARTTLDEQRKRMRDSILEEIRAALVVKAKKDGYAMVIDTASETVNNTPVVLFCNNENDVTQAVLDQLNANAPVELPKTEEKSDGKKTDGKKTEKKQ
ncbi:MAG: OmpH family outer membrane protein [Verrucomicrobiota bacterium]